MTHRLQSSTKPDGKGGCLTPWLIVRTSPMF